MRNGSIVVVLLGLLVAACDPEPGPAVDDDDAGDDDATGDDDTTSDDDATDDSGSDDDTTPPDGPEVSWSIADNPTNPFSAVITVEADLELTLAIEYGYDGEFDRSTPSVDLVAEQPAEVLVLGMKAGREYQLRPVATVEGQSWTGEPLVFQTEPLPGVWPSCEVVTDLDPIQLDPDEVFCTNVENIDAFWIYCVDRQGEPVWSLAHPDGHRMMVFQPLSDGTIAATGSSDDFLVFFDERGARLIEYPSIWFEDRTRYFHNWVNPHEVIEIQEGQWTGAVAFIAVTEDWPDGVTHFGAGIVVFDPLTETVLWDWASHAERMDGVPIDPLLPYHRYGLGYSGETWHHANAIIHEVDDTGHEYFWLNLRNQDWIVKIDTETDEVVWRLGYEGDFELVDDLDAVEPVPLDPRQWMFRAHAPEVLQSAGGRTRFLLFDNGVFRPGLDGEPDQSELYSRVVEFEIDEVSRRATVVRSFGDPDPLSPDHFYSDYYGDANLLPGGQSLTYVKGEEGPYVAELSYPDGAEIWRLVCEPEWDIYRALYFPSVYALAGME